MLFRLTASRGQALIETAIALPLFLLAMFGIVWALQSGVLGERVQLVARYGGMVSAEINPYQQYSLYAAYNAAAGTPLATTCATPPPALLSDGSPLAAPATGSAAFWLPTAGSPNASVTCGHALATGGLSQPMLLGNAQIAVSASTDTPYLLQGALGSAAQPRSATLTGFASPDMNVMVGCYAELQSAFEHSVSPGSDYAPPSVPQPITTYDTGPLTLTGGC